MRLSSIRFFAACAVFSSAGALATPSEDLRAFVRDVKSGKASFTQTVTSPKGKQKVTRGRFEFARPGRFRFDYDKPYAQTVVGDGVKVWIHDPDLNQVSSRKVGEALGGTPAALLVSNDVDKAFTLADQPPADGLEWVQATPRQAEGTVRWIKAGFKGRALAQLEIADSFGQRSLMVFDQLQPNVEIAPADFAFTPPKGADVVEQ